VTRILVLNPFGGTTLELENCRAIARPDTEVVFDNLAPVYPLSHVNHRLYRTKAAELAAIRIVRAEQEGFDAVVDSCGADPGVQEARGLVDIPVVGVLEATVHYAAMIAHRFSIVVVTDSIISTFRDLVTLYGLASKLASVRPIGYIPPKLYPEVTPPRVILDKVIEVSRRCVEEDGAEAIVMGGTLFSAFFTQTYRDPCEPIGAPILDPTLVGFKTAEMMVDLRKLAGIPAVSRVATHERPDSADLARFAAYYGWGQNGQVETGQVETAARQTV
jgi:allantoin racemase